ncbi:MAG: hypothetical protein ACM3PF_11690 [Bacteroidota bacterium]
MIRARAPRMAVLAATAFLFASSGCGRHDEPATTTGQPQAVQPADTVHIDVGEGTTPQDAVALIRAYYQAINNNRFQDAYQMWEGKGAASGKPYLAFLNGYAQADRFDVKPGQPGAVVVSGTTQMIAVPVEVMATRSNKTDRYGGTITLRRSMERNAAADLRRWHIFKLDLKPAA